MRPIISLAIRTDTELSDADLKRIMLGIKDACEDVLDSEGHKNYSLHGGAQWVDDDFREPLGIVRKNDPDTSKKAAQAHKLTRKGHTLKLLGLYAENGPDGWTADELADETEIEYRTLTPRIGYLKRHGFVAPTGEKRIGKRGLEQEVKAITQYGSAQLMAFHNIHS